MRLLNETFVLCTVVFRFFQERKVLERVDLQNMESLASQKNAAGAAASSSTGDREVETRKIEDNLNSSMEKLSEFMN